jgi:hypothetical protein
MGNDRYTRGGNPQGDDYGRTDPSNYGRSSGGGDYGRSSAREYQAAGMLGGDRQRQGGYGNNDYGSGGYGPRDGDRQREEHGRDGRDYYDGRSEQDRGSRPHYDDQQRQRFGGDQQRHRSSFERQQNRGGCGRQPRGYDYEDRGFLARAGDEVRSWFGDDDAERRREADSRYDDGDGRGQSSQGGRYARDHDYHSWRSAQIAALDRDYDEYRREHQTKFHNEFSSWRMSREGQRAMLAKVEDHMEVLGADGAHVGTVDKVRGDRILLTKNDSDAGGRHHSIPSSWISSVDDKVTLTKTAIDAKAAWKTEERQAMFGDEPQAGKRDDGRGDDVDGKGHVLNKSFPGTY